MVKEVGFISSGLLLDSHVVGGAVIHQAEHCRVYGNERYRGCAEVTKKVVEVSGEGCWCSLQRRPLETVAISAARLIPRPLAI